MRGSRRFLFLMIALLGLLALTACSPSAESTAGAGDSADQEHDSDDHSHDEEDAEHTHDNDDPEHTHAEGEDDHPVGGVIPGAPEVVIVATDEGCTPETARLTAGEPVNIVLVNDGEEEHDLLVEAFGIELFAISGVRAVAGFTPEATGEFGFVCTGANAGEDVVGRLIVE